MRSNRPEAKPFQDWVTKVVLPAIRKDGGYILAEEKVATGEKHGRMCAGIQKSIWRSPLLHKALS